MRLRRRLPILLGKPRVVYRKTAALSEFASILTRQTLSQLDTPKLNQLQKISQDNPYKHLVYLVFNNLNY